MKYLSIVFSALILAFLVSCGDKNQHTVEFDPDRPLGILDTGDAGNNGGGLVLHGEQLLGYFGAGTVGKAALDNQGLVNLQAGILHGLTKPLQSKPTGGLPGIANHKGEAPVAN